MSGIFIDSIVGGGSGGGAGAWPGDATACNDGTDNDGDGIADWPGDMGCTGPYDDDESGDNTVVVYANITGTQLNNCINGSDQASICNNVSNSKGTYTTVCGNTSNSSSCNGVTMRTVTNTMDFTYTNTSYNSLHFSSFNSHGAGYIGIDISNTRLVNAEVISPGPGADDFGVSSGSSGIVIANSLLDGQYANPYYIDNQIGFNAANARIINNLIRNFGPTGPPPDDHAEALYIQAGATNMLIKGNDFENNSGTSHIFFTDGGTPEAFAQYVCVRDNLFGPRGTAANDIAERTGTSSNQTLIYIEDSSSNRLNPATRSSPAMAFAFVSGGNRSCLQCNDGLDNDGDGKADYWADGLGDSGCTAASDNSE